METHTEKEKSGRLRVSLPLLAKIHENRNLGNFRLPNYCLVILLYKLASKNIMNCVWSVIHHLLKASFCYCFLFFCYFEIRLLHQADISSHGLKLIRNRALKLVNYQIVGGRQHHIYGLHWLFNCFQKLFRML